MTAPQPSTPEEFAKCFYTPEQIALMTDRSWDAVIEEIRARDAALLAPLRAEVERLREALRPFAEFGAVVGGNARDHVCGMYVAVGKRRDLHVSDFRAAAKALAPEGGK